MPEVGVIVPCYNYAEYLGECIESILSQTYKDFELIILNDCSTDHTDEVVKSFNDPRIRYVTNENNLGNIRNYNKGMRLSSPDVKYLSLISADDKYGPHFLEKAVEKFGRFPEVGLVYTQIIFIDENGKETSRGYHRIPYKKDFKGRELDKMLLSVNHIPSFAIARRRCWLETGLFDINSKNAADWLIWMEIARNWESYFINEYLSFYRVHSKSQHRDMMLLGEAERDALYAVNKIYSYKDLSQNVIKIKKKVYANLFISNILSYLTLGYREDVRRCFRKAIEIYPPAIINLKALICFFLSFLNTATINKIRQFRAKIKQFVLEKSRRRPLCTLSINKSRRT